MLASLIPIWVDKYFPSQNGPEYLLIVQMMKEFFNPVFNYSDYYKLDYIVIPNLLFHFLVYLLYQVFPLLISYKIALSLNVILLPLSVFYFIKSVDSRKIIFGFASFVYVYNYFLTKGYDSYYFSIPVFFFCFGYFIKHSKDMRWENYIWLSIGLLILFLSHIFSYALSIFIIPVYVLLHDQNCRKLSKVITAFIPSFILLGYYAFFVFGKAGSLVESNQYWLRYDPFYIGIFYSYLKTFIGMAMYSFSEWAILLFYIPVGFVVYLIAKKIMNRYHETPLSALSRTTMKTLLKKDTMLFLLIILTLLFFVFPSEIMGWPKFNKRLLPFIFILMLVSPEMFSKKTLQNLYIGLVSVSGIVIYVMMTFQVVKINDVLDDYTSGIPFIKENKTLLPVHIETYRIGKISPVHWAFNYYNIDKGGATNRSVAHYTGRVLINYKPSVKRQFPDLIPKLLFSTAIKYHTDLDKGFIRNELKNEFKNNGFSLSQFTTLRIENKGSHWIILDKDAEKTYDITIAKDKLNVYNYPFENKDIIRQIRKTYDYVLFWGENKWIFKLFQNNGFQLLHQQGDLHLYSNLSKLAIAF